MIALCVAALLLIGCFVAKKLVDDHMLDGPDMVDYGGLLMDTLSGEWISGDGRCRAVLQDYRISIRFGDGGEGDALLKDASLLLYANSADMDAHHAFSIEPNVLAVEDGEPFATVEEASTERGRITLRLTMAGGTETTVVLERDQQPPDSPDGE